MYINCDISRSWSHSHLPYRLGMSGMDQFLALHSHFLRLSFKSQALFLTAYAKLVNLYPECKEAIHEVRTKACVCSFYNPLALLFGNAESTWQCPCTARWHGMNHDYPHQIAPTCHTLDANIFIFVYFRNGRTRAYSNMSGRFLNS